MQDAVAAGVALLREHGHLREPAASVEAARSSGDWSGVSVEDLLAPGPAPLVDRDSGEEGTPS